MTKVTFDKCVKYDGVVYPPNTTFKIEDSHIELMEKLGGKFSNLKKDKKGDDLSDDLSHVHINSPKQKENTNLPHLSENMADSKGNLLEKLRNEAIELGIQFKGPWGIKKLQEAIEKEKLGLGK